MPNRCSVANCSSNYDCIDYVPVFEMLNRWYKEVEDEGRSFLHRDDACKLVKVFICARYFSDNDILLHLDIPQGDGTVKYFQENMFFRKMPSPLIFLTVLHIYKDLLNTQNI